MSTPYYSISNIITWAKACQSLAALGENKSKSFKGLSISDSLDQKLYIARKSLEWEYAQNQNSSLIYELADYVYALCFPYLLKAQQITVDGGLVVIPVTPISGTPVVMPFKIIKVGDFTNATDYTNSIFIGKDISVFMQNFNRYLESDEFVLLADGTVRILVNGFDGTSGTIGKIVMRVDINGEAPASTIIDTFTYDLTELTNITGVQSGVENQTRRFIIFPNGYSYTWDTDYFSFDDLHPEQPEANGVNTKQIYDFIYDPTTGKNICSNQVINIAI